MDAPDLLGMTDQQRDYVLSLQHRCERLNALCLAETNQRRQFEAELRQEREFRAAEKAEYAEELKVLGAEVQDLLNSGLAARNELIFLGRHLPEFIGDWLNAFRPFSDSALTPEMVARRKVAQEIWLRLEPFRM